MNKKCAYCQKEIPDNFIKFCSVDCATKAANGIRRIQRACSCGKIEFISNYNQLKRKCRSCSKVGNTSSQNMTTEARQKISDSKKGKTAWNKGKTDIYSEETKKAMGIKNKGTQHAIEQRTKISKGLHRYYESHDGPNKGISKTDSQKLRISDTLFSKRGERTNTTEEEAKIYCKSLNLELVAIMTNDGYVSKSQPITVKCGALKKDGSVCGKEYNTNLNYLELGANHKCKSCSCAMTKPENEIHDFIVNELQIEETDILRNKRPSFMNGKELDMWIPSKSIAIEHHGLVHHSERTIHYEKNLTEIRRLHEEKYINAKRNGIKLIQIFEDEWLDKKEICKSIIRSKMGMSINKIYARKCEVRKIEPRERKIFFEQSHIAGDTMAPNSWGLFYEGELVSVISMRGTWNKRWGNCIEIARFASKRNHSIVGGFQKLLKVVKEWANTLNIDAILTYADCRFGSGEVYRKSGFDYQGKTDANYFYEKDGVREGRFQHKKNLYSKGSTEREQQNNLGWYAIYDAGSEIYLMKLK